MQHFYHQPHTYSSCLSSPYGRLHGQNTSISYFNIFGLGAWVPPPNQKQDISPIHHTSCKTLVGYNDILQGCHPYDPTSHPITEHRDVNFV